MHEQARTDTHNGSAVLTRLVAGEKKMQRRRREMLHAWSQEPEANENKNGSAVAAPVKPAVIFQGIVPEELGARGAETWWSGQRLCGEASPQGSHQS
jgi:hypothetical protein